MQRIIEAKGEFFSTHHFVDKEWKSIGIDVISNLLAYFLVVRGEPDQGDIIIVDRTAVKYRWLGTCRAIGSGCDGDSSGICLCVRQSGYNVGEMAGLIDLHRIDGRLAMLGRDDEQS